MEIVCRYTDPDSVKENRLEGYDISHYVQNTHGVETKARQGVSWNSP